MFPFVFPGFVTLTVVLSSIAYAIKIQTISEATQERPLRLKRDATTGSAVVGDGIFGNQTLILSSTCVRLETNSIGFSARQFTQAAGAMSLNPFTASNGTTMVVTGSCVNSTPADLTVVFSNLAAVTNTSSASFSFHFTQDAISWYLSSVFASISFADALTKEHVVLTDRPISAGIHATLDTAYYCNNQHPLATFWNAYPTANNLQLSLIFENLIVQPFMASPAAGYTANEGCEYAFGIGIWMAIICGLIMAAILGFGVAMLANVQAPLRLDDPKLD
ncbi:hypothetical protein BV898_09615 [Hypsibius exemplaris]|uniref:V-type proton ATPase subunit S1/VOA1 transmembrane domain-containing protein n=1 Tax=Hypsibius exemplaris TaxID=2072580 RepID=A0A1W0WMC2_HYPEX|nr:hypothetical protein BV898_09615 [Hypsibius exemplaris]